MSEHEHHEHHKPETHQPVWSRSDLEEALGKITHRECRRERKRCNTLVAVLALLAVILLVLLALCRRPEHHPMPTGMDSHPPIVVIVHVPSPPIVVTAPPPAPVVAAPVKHRVHIVRHVRHVAHRVHHHHRHHHRCCCR